MGGWDATALLVLRCGGLSSLQMFLPRCSVHRGRLPVSKSGHSDWSKQAFDPHLRAVDALVTVPFSSPPGMLWCAGKEAATGFWLWRRCSLPTSLQSAPSWTHSRHLARTQARRVASPTFPLLVLSPQAMKVLRCAPGRSGIDQWTYPGASRAADQAPGWHFAGSGCSFVHIVGHHPWASPAVLTPLMLTLTTVRLCIVAGYWRDRSLDLGVRFEQ